MDEIVDDGRRSRMPQEAAALPCCRHQGNHTGRRNLILDLLDFAKQLHQGAQPWIAGEAFGAIVRLEIEDELRAHDVRVPCAAYTLPPNVIAGLPLVGEIGGVGGDPTFKS